MKFRIGQGFALFFLMSSVVMSAEVRVSNNQQLRQALSQAGPGTILMIEPGEYNGGVFISNLHGTSDKPITIRAADANRRPVFRDGNSGWQISNATHLVLDGLVIRDVRANGLNIDDGGKKSGTTHHITIRNVEVRDIGTNGGNLDGIKLSGIDDFLVERCRLVNWGSGGSAIDMVGCHKGVIRECFFTADESNQGTGVQAKGGSSDVVVQACRFENAGTRAVNIGGSTGLAFFRPEDANYEARAIVVEDSVFFGSHAPIAFVGVDGARVHHNTIYKPGKFVVRILQETTDQRFVPCRRGVFEQNLVVYDPALVSMSTNVGPKTDPQSFVFRGNAWISIGGRGRIRHEIPGTGDLDASHADFEDAYKLDLRQKAGSATSAIGSRSIWASKPAEMK